MIYQRTIMLQKADFCLNREIFIDSIHNIRNPRQNNYNENDIVGTLNDQKRDTTQKMDDRKHSIVLYCVTASPRDVADTGRGRDNKRDVINILQMGRMEESIFKFRPFTTQLIWYQVVCAFQKKSEGRIGSQRWAMLCIFIS